MRTMECDICNMMARLVDGIHTMDAKAGRNEQEIYHLLFDLPVYNDVDWKTADDLGYVQLRSWNWGRWKPLVCRDCTADCSPGSCSRQEDWRQLSPEDFVAALAKGLREVAEAQRERLSLRNKQLRSLRQIARS